MAVALNQLERETDVRRVLRTVQAPTLVLHRRDEAVYHVEEGRYLARHIPGARLVELEGADHLPGDGDMSAVDRRDRSIPRFGARRGGLVRSGARIRAVHRHRGIDREGGRTGRPTMAGDRRGPPRHGPSDPGEVSRGRDRHRRRRVLRDVRRTRPRRALRAGDRRGRSGARPRGPRRGPHGRGRDDRREGRRHRREHRGAGRRDGGPVGGPRLVDREGPRRRVRPRLRGPRRARDSKGIPDRWHLYGVVP